MRRTVGWIARFGLSLALSACLGGNPQVVAEVEAPDHEWPEGRVDPPDADALRVTFSHEPRFYDSAFRLELSANEEDASIYYTVDGSRPNPALELDDAAWERLPASNRARTFRYQGPIALAPLIAAPNDLSEIPTNALPPGRGWESPRGRVQRAAVVRAMAVRGQEVSRVVSGTYFIDERERERYSLPVISVMTDPANLFDEAEGIYVTGRNNGSPNYNQRGGDWERLAHLELFDTDNARPVSQAVGLRLHGAFTRRFPQKSLRVYARAEYGQSQLRYPFFPTKDQDRFKRLLLRNGGNDWGGTLLKDATLQALVQHLPLETQHAQPAVVFIDGEYWGIHNLRDHLDDHHLALRHQVDRDQITILEGAKNGVVVDTGLEEDRDEYLRFLTMLAEGQLSTFESVDEHIALSELLDYAITQCYAANNDWPANNSRWWRYRAPQPGARGRPLDGRWRWLLYDVDRSFGTIPATFDMIEYLFEPSRDDPPRQIFRDLARIEAVRHELIQRLGVHLATTFHPRRVRARLAAGAGALEPEMAEHIARWTKPDSLDEWRDAVALADDFAQVRPELMRAHVVQFFEEVSGVAELRIKELDGAHQLSAHTIMLSPEAPGVYLHDGEWSAEVFAGVPFVLESDVVDLSMVQIEGAPPRSMEASPQRLTLVLEPGGRVTITLPRS